MEALGHQHNTPEWSFFIDSSKVILKAVLLHNGYKYPSLLLAHIVNMKESRENKKLLLEKIHYEKYKWNICGDLKVIALLLGYTAVFCVNGTAGTEATITCKNSGQNEIHLFQEKKCAK
jgi:hypothetical protein